MAVVTSENKNTKETGYSRNPICFDVVPCKIRFMIGQRGRGAKIQWHCTFKNYVLRTYRHIDLVVSMKKRR